MGLNKNLVFAIVSITCLTFSLLVESTRTTHFLTPEPQPSLLSPEAQPLEKYGILQVYGDIVKHDIELIKESYQWVFKAEKDLEFLPSDSHVPKACIKPCAKAYTSIIKDLKNADNDLGATNFQSVNEDYDSFSDSISACEECLGHGGKSKHACPLQKLNDQLKKHALEWLASVQFVGF